MLLLLYFLPPEACRNNSRPCSNHTVSNPRDFPSPIVTKDKQKPSVLLVLHFRPSLRCDSPASAPDPQPEAHALFSYFSVSQTLKDCELRIWRELVLLPSRAEVHGTSESVFHFVVKNLSQGCTKALWHQQEAF